MFGYFSSGGEVSVVDGRAVYDYDRGYPYEWYRPISRNRAASSFSSAGYDEARRSDSGLVVHCDTQWVTSGGGKSAVRICRGR